MATNEQGPTPDNANWKAVLDELDISYRQRRLSGALVALCIFHDEKTPSMYMWPDGNLYCHGCGAKNRVEGFTGKVLVWREETAVWQRNWAAREAELVRIYGPDTFKYPF